MDNLKYVVELVSAILGIISFFMSFKGKKIQKEKNLEGNFKEKNFGNIFWIILCIISLVVFASTHFGGFKLIENTNKTEININGFIFY